MRESLQRIWYSTEVPPWGLRALSWLFVSAAALRRAWLQRRARQTKLSVPVVVVGNISVGGTGKTPFVLWLVERLREWGWRPGVISRGYGGRAQAVPLRVTPVTPATECGDEPLLLAQRLDCPLMVCPDRVAAAHALAATGTVDIIVSDDGLQHYRLRRDLEIAVVDGERGLGNGHRLPAGPLREPARRLESTHLVVINGTGWKPATALPAPPMTMRLEGPMACSLADGRLRSLGDFSGQRVHAVAGVGNPARFFSLLSRMDIRLVMHPFADHHPFCARDLAFGDELPVLMTEKDAVKCRAFADARMWSVPVSARIAPEDTMRVRELVSRLKR